MTCSHSPRSQRDRTRRKGPPPTNFYALRDNLHEAVVSVKGTLDYAYTVDGKVLNLPPFPGTVSRHEQGIQWLFANGLTLRLNLPDATAQRGI